jgi:hypothetical protein
MMDDPCDDWSHQTWKIRKPLTESRKGVRIAFFMHCPEESPKEEDNGTSRNSRHHLL